MILIGISGKKGTGKDLLASFLKNKYQFVNLPFAAELKYAVREVYRLTTDHTDGYLKETPVTALNGFTPREAMIDEGCLRRKYNPNFWVEAVFDKIQKIKLFGRHDNDFRVCISDVRFKNEADRIKREGGYLVRLERKPELNIYKELSTDISETELDNYERFDFKLGADENIAPEDLEKFADDIMASLYVGGL